MSGLSCSAQAEPGLVIDPASCRPLSSNMLCAWVLSTSGSLVAPEGAQLLLMRKGVGPSPSFPVSFSAESQVLRRP